MRYQRGTGPEEPEARPTNAQPARKHARPIGFKDLLAKSDAGSKFRDLAEVIWESDGLEEV